MKNVDDLSKLPPSLRAKSLSGNIKQDYKVFGA
jgi:hypothetical protein